MVGSRRVQPDVMWGTDGVRVFTGHAPARSAPALSQAQQDRPRPFGRAPGPLAVIFWYACRVRHPRRSRLRAFSMALAVIIAVVPPAAFAAFYCWIVVRDGSALAAVAYEHGRGCGSGS